MNLYEAFGIIRGDVVSLIGAGGKTRSLLRLGAELSALGWRVLATASTDIDPSLLSRVPRAVSLSDGFAAIADALTDDGFVLLYDRIDGDTVTGLSSEAISGLMDALEPDVMLVEADVADGMPLKSPYKHEPFIPKATSLVVLMASMTAIGQPLDERHVYNASAICEQYGFVDGTDIKTPWIGQILRDEALGLYNVPPDVPMRVFLNDTPLTSHGLGQARFIANLTLRASQIEGVVIGSADAEDPGYEVHRPIAAMVLAAGRSSRMGSDKLLLPWKGNRSIIQHIVDQLSNARIEHISIVVGFVNVYLRSHLRNLKVEVTQNPDYKTGEMFTSVQAGIGDLPKRIAAVFVVLGDQPTIETRIVQQLMNAYAEGKGDLIIPSYKQRRGHPVLIGRKYWAEILAMPQTATLRDFIDAHTDDITYVNVNSDSILRDVDTP